MTTAGSPVQRAARPALALLAVYAGASVWASSVDLRELLLVRDALDGAVLSDAVVNAAYERQKLTGFAFLGVLAVTSVLFLRWLHAASKTLVQLGEHLEYTPRATVVGFFIPFLNLWRPYQAVANLWRMSAAGGPERVDSPTPGLMKAWWLAWIGGGIATRLAAGQYAQAETLTQLESALHQYLATGIFDLVCTALAAMLVSRLTQRIDERWIAAGGSVPLPEARA